MADERAVAQHLLDCFDSFYRVLGEGAPTLTSDAYVVRVHEMSRAFGGLALDVRECLDATPRRFELVDAVLGHSLSSDESGAMALFCVSMVLGPRLLVSLNDAREVASEPWRTLWVRAADVVVAQVLAIGEVAKGQAPIEDPSWQFAARDLTETLEAAGYGESLGLSR